MPENTKELNWKNITVLLPDPSLSDSYYESWIPQDDLDLMELKENLLKIEDARSVSFFDDHRSLMKKWLVDPPEFVFNQCDDGYMNDEEMEVHLTTFMDMLKIPYTGPNFEGLVIVKDKSLVRACAMSVGVPVPLEVFIDVTDDISSKIPDDMVYPAFCKLGNASGSTGVIEQAVAHNREDAINGLSKLREMHPQRPLLLQEFLNGREFSIAVVGNPELDDFEVFHPVEVDYSGLDPRYPKVQLEEFKRDGDSFFWQQVKEVKAELSPQLLSEIKEYARRIFIRTRCKDFARMDFRMNFKGQLKLMDVNPNCWLGGKYRMMAEWEGYDWPQILTKIVRTCQNRNYLKFQKEAEKMAQKAERERSIKLKVEAQVQEFQKRQELRNSGRIENE